MPLSKGGERVVKFCSDCGGPIEVRIPQNDDRERFICAHCEAVHYRNPRIVAGCLVTHGEQVLLCRRAIAPRRGYWTLPAGFLENGETVAEGALRETWEEARAEVELEGLYTLFNLPHINQVYMFYRARLPAPRFASGPESLEVALFDAPRIPWQELAFGAVEHSLRHWLADRERNHYPVRSADVRVSADGRRTFHPVP